MPDSADPVIRGGAPEDPLTMVREEQMKASIAGLIHTGEKLVVIVTLGADGKTHTRSESYGIAGNRFSEIKRLYLRALKQAMAEARGLGLFEPNMEGKP